MSKKSTSRQTLMKEREKAGGDRDRKKKRGNRKKGKLNRRSLISLIPQCISFHSVLRGAATQKEKTKTRGIEMKKSSWLN